MARLPDRETSLRWIFLTLGWVLFGGAPLVVHAVPQLKRQPWTTGLFALILLCFVTTWGLKRHRPWSRWTAIAACAILLLGVPWLTPIGALGLYLILRRPWPGRPAGPEDFWDPRRQSLLSAIVPTLGFAGALWCSEIFGTYVQRIGLPDVHSVRSDPTTGWLAVASLLFGSILHAAVHEGGHAFAAWTVGHRVKAINVGPITVWRDRHGFHMRFHWMRLLSSGGYMGAVPASEKGIWANEIFIIAAGPLTSLTAGMALAWAFFLLPGTQLAPYWESFALLSTLGFYAAVVNLIPSGYTDGTMLFHILFRTRHGEELIARILSGQAFEDANQRRIAGDHEGALALRRAALERLLKSPVQNPLPLAQAYAGLGLEELATGSRTAAEASFRSGLALLAANGGNLGIETNCQVGLHRVYLLQHRLAEAAEAYRAARQAIEKLIEHPPEGNDRLSLRTGLAELLTHAGAFDSALPIIDQTLTELSSSASHRRLKGLLLRFRTTCELQLGHPVFGLAAAEEAGVLWRSGRGSGRLDAPQQMALMADALWSGGQAEPAVSLLRECIDLLDKRGEPNTANRHRLLLTEILWRGGRIDEAEQALPGPVRSHDGLRKRFLEQRAAIHERAGRAEEAQADYSELLRLAETESPPDPIKITIAHSNLAAAYLETGNLEEAERLAQESWRKLSAADHPQAASTCVTLALISWRKERTTYGWLDEAQRRFDEAPLIRHANKARFSESTAARLEKASLLEEAIRFRVAADTHWRALGLTAKNSAGPVPV